MKNFLGLIKNEVEFPAGIKKICRICKSGLTKFCGFSRGQTLFCKEFSSPVIIVSSFFWNFLVAVDILDLWQNHKYFDLNF